MTLYEISITNHSGYPFYRWENPNRPKAVVNTVKFTRYPPLSGEDRGRNFELECGYRAAMSITALGQQREVTSIKEMPVSRERIIAEGSDKDIIFDLTVDVYMNSLNLYKRMRRSVDTLIYKEKRPYLEDNPLSEEEQTMLKSVFNELEARKLINEKSTQIGRVISETLQRVKGEEKKLYEYGILGVGILTSSYNILFYNGLKTYLGLTDEDIDFPGKIPETEDELAEILALAQMPKSIDGGESMFAYPYGLNIMFLIHNFEIGPEILGEREPFHLIVGVRAGFPSKTTIDDLIVAITPYLLD